MYMHLSVLIACVSFVINNVTVASDAEIARASSMMYEGPECVHAWHDRIHEAHDDRIMCTVSCFDAGKPIASFDVVKSSLKHFGMLKEMFSEMQADSAFSACSVPINLKKCYVKNAEQEVEAVRTLLSLHDPSVVVSNLQIPGKKAMLVHANELDASISIWAVLSAAMPYEFCEHMLYETGYHEITGYKEGLFMEAFNKVFDTKQKEKLVLGFYKNLYTCEAFKMLCKEAKEAREKKNAALTAAELCALQSKKNWEVSSSYLWFTQLFSKKVEYLRGVHGKCRKVFDIVCINDGFLHLPCLALYYDATKTIDDHKIETTYDLHSIDLTNKQARYITELDVRAIQSIASMHTVKHWLRLQIDLSDNAQIDWQALQKLRFLSNEGPIDIQFKTNRYTPGEYSLVADNAYMQIIRGLGVRAFAAVCGLLLLYKLLAWDDKIGYKHYCNKLETVSNTIAPEVKSHAVYLAQQTHKVLPGKSVYLPRGLDWRSVKAQYPTDTKQVTNALLAINQLTAIDSQYDILCQKTDFFEGVTAAIGLVGGLCAIFLNVFDPCNRVIPDGKGGIKSSKWKYLRFIGSPPIACDIEFEKKT